MTVSQIIVWIIVGGLAGTLAGRVVTFKKAGLGRWMNFLVGIIGAFLGGGVFKLFRIDLGLGDLKVSFEDLIAAFLGSLVVIFAWRIISKIRVRKSDQKIPIQSLSKNRRLLNSTHIVERLLGLMGIDSIQLAFSSLVPQHLAARLRRTH